MVVFVVLYRLQQALSVELKLCLEVLDYLLVQKIWPLNYLELLAALGQDV